MMIAVSLSLLIAQDAASHPWGKHKPGTWAKYETKTRAGEAEMPATTDTYTLREVTADYAVVNFKSDYMDNDQKMPFKGAGAESEAKDKGTATIEAAGKSYTCQVKEVTSAGATTTTWNCKDAPGGWVKATTSGTGSETTTILVAASEKVKVGDKEVTCWVTETTTKMAAGASTTKIWMSNDVPGLQVMMETNSEMAGTKMVSTRTLVGFEIK